MHFETRQDWKVTPREALDIFMSVLAVNGFTTVKIGKITKIIPIKDAQTSPVQIRVMEKQKPPVRIIAPGRCYRRYS